MEKIKYRFVIKFYVLEYLNAKEIYERLLKVYQESTPLKRTVEFWVAKFSNGSTTEDSARSGYPKTAPPIEIVQVHNTLLDVQRRKVPEIADAN